MKVFFVHSKHHEDILREEGCRLLVSYPYCRDGYRSPEIPSGFSEVIIDSGAYQLQTGTKEVHIRGYALWLHLVLPKHPEVIAYMNLDILRDSLATMENQFYLESEGLNPLPVWHAGEDMAFLDYYCEKYEWVSIGALVSRYKANKEHTLNLANFILQKYPNTKFHFFGIGISGAKAYKQVRPYSCDFSTWSTAARFGNIIIEDRKQIIKEVPMSNQDKERLRTDAEYQRKIIRFSVKNILMFEKTLTEMENSNKQLLLY